MNSSAESITKVIDQFTVGWVTRQIQEIAQVNPRIDKKLIPDDLVVSFVPMPAVEAESGAIDVSRTRLAKEVKKGYTAFLEGDVLFAKITPCMENGKMAIVPALVNNYGIGSTEFHVLRPGEHIDAKYLYYYVSSKSFRGEAERYMSGAVGQRRVQTTYLKEITIPVAPLEVQHRIVAEIEKQFSRLDKAVASLKRVKANFKRYKAAVLKAAVEGKLTKEWRKQNPDVEPASKLLKRISVSREEWVGQKTVEGKNEAKRLLTKLRKHEFKVPADMVLPDGWVWASFLKVSLIVVDCHNKTAPYEQAGIPLVRTTNIRDGKLDLETTKYISEETYAYWSRRCPPEPGDILFTREAPMGEAAIIPDGVTLCMGQRMMLLRVPHEMVDNRYVLSWIMSPTFQGKLRGDAVGTGVKHLRVGDVEKLIVPLPPSKEQLQILNVLDQLLSVIEKHANQVDENLHRATHLRQSILGKAFAGQLACGSAHLSTSLECMQELSEHCNLNRGTVNVY